MNIRNLKFTELEFESSKKLRIHGLSCEEGDSITNSLILLETKHRISDYLYDVIQGELLFQIEREMRV